MRVLVVGLNPSRKHGNSSSLKVLFKWFDILNIKYASFTNLYEGYEITRATCKIEFVRDISREYDRVLALGQTVSDHLSRVDVHHYNLPHPSGLNRRLNDKKYVHDQLEACKNYLRVNHEIL